MIKMNEAMKVILEKKKDQDCNIQINVVLEEIINKTKIIKDCIIYDKDGSLEEEKIDFNVIMQFVGDLTGYEISCNEIRLDNDKIIPSQILIFTNKLGYMLSQKYINRKIVIYMSSYDNEFELRFHTYRKNERLWLDEDLNKYDIPILCWM